jgi:hypothetical protein
MDELSACFHMVFFYGVFDAWPAYKAKSDYQRASVVRGAWWWRWWQQQQAFTINCCA